MANAKKMTMDELLAEAGDSVKQAVIGETVTGTVLSVKKHEILIDLGAQGVGLVPRKEVSFGRFETDWNHHEGVGDHVDPEDLDWEKKFGNRLGDAGRERAAFAAQGRER